MRYIRLLLLHFQRASEIRSRSFVWFLLALVPPFTMIIFWNGATTNGRTIDGWTFPMLASYYLYIMIATVLTLSHIEEEVANLDIKEGGISPYLLKPFSYYWLKLFLEIPYRVIQGGFGIIVLLSILVLYPHFLVITNSPLLLVLTAIMIVLAYILSFTLKMIIGILAFWLTEIRGMFEITEVLILILGGTLMPVPFYPPLLMQITQALPLSYVIYYPVIALQGQVALPQMLQILTVQIIWIVALGFVYQKLWKAGSKEYTAIGQ